MLPTTCIPDDHGLIGHNHGVVLMVDSHIGKAWLGWGLFITIMLIEEI